MAYYMIGSEHPELVTLPLNISCHEAIMPPDETAHFSAFNEHNHASVEILYITSGELFVELEHRPYHLKTGDVILFNPYDIHKAWFSGNGMTNSYLCITTPIDRLLRSFNKSVLGATAQDLNQLRSGFDHFYPAGTAVAQQLGAHMIGINDAFYKKTIDSECAVMQHMFALLTSLFDGHYHMTDANERHNLEFIQSVSKYVSEYYRQNLTTADVAAALFMTTSNFCHQFRQNFGCRFLQYLCEFRIQRSLSYADQHMNIAQIASEVGFSDYCYFSRSFRKHIGISPAKYFGKWH